jgi:hypothetical protein
MKSVFFALSTFLFSLSSSVLLAQNDEIRGTYKAVLLHEATGFYQNGIITLRTANIEGQIRISANVRVIFGDQNSNEYLTYEYAEVPYNFLTGQLSLRDDNNDISLTGTIRSGRLAGEWFSSLVGRVGTFEAIKDDEPAVPNGAELVQSLSGYYRGTLTNTNQQSNLPERVTMSFVTTQETGADGPTLRITGNVRFYLGPFDSIEYVETPFSSVQFNFYNRYLTAKTTDYGITFKGTMNLDGSFDGQVLSDGIGSVGTVEANRFP